MSASSPSDPGRISLPILLALAVLSTVGPFAVDLYLPAFPSMIDELTTTATGAQLSLTGFLAGVAAGQLAFGPLSDRFGRIPPLLVGLSLYVVASAATVFAPTVEILVIARLAQGVGAAAGMVISRAIIADLVRGAEAARVLSLMMVAAGIAPISAPVLGGALTAAIGWRGLMGILLVLGCVMLITAMTVLKETYPAARRAEVRAERDLVLSARRSLRSPAFLTYVVTFAASTSALFAYIAASPFIYQTMMGLPEWAFGLFFGLNATALVSANAVNSQLVRRIPVPTLLRTGITGILGSGVIFALLVLFAAPPIWLALPIFTLSGSFGLVTGNATALALSVVPRAAAGRASAILGSSQFGLGAIIAPVVGLAGEESAAPSAVVILSCGVIAAVAFFLARRQPPEDQRLRNVAT